MRSLTLPGGICLLLLAAGTVRAVAPAEAPANDPALAPDFDKADGWLNTEKPISIKGLRGQIVVLDFWTYCCINCMHVLPDLKYLEEKYKDKPVVVIGVHSGKFDEEKDAQHIRNAILRHNISHPVAIDSDYAIWNSYGVRAWPTVVVIDPEGHVIGAASGEGNRQVLDAAIGRLLDVHGRKGTLGQHVSFRKERDAFKSGTLEFPGKVLADEKSKRLFVADTNHHRVLVADLDGKVTQTIGAGKMGFKDGSFDAAQFYQPQGMALSADGGTLYVADTENHAVRAADLSSRTVKTVAGTGEQARHALEGEGPKTAISSPWDLARVGERLFIAMAGTHQIWALDLTSGLLARFAGTGRESSGDGDLAHATFAQPSGLATDGTVLYVADAEASTIRSVGLADNGAVTSVAGSNDLFGFGSADGVGGAARFQHPLGVALDATSGTLYVADTFNNLIRSIDPKTGRVDTFAGTGKSDEGTEAAIGFFEPGGLSFAGGTLYVADTNHHRIVALDRATKKARVIGITPQ